MIGEWIPPEHREIHDYLIHWGRWLKEHHPPGHCFSIEHRYRLKRIDDTPTGYGDWQVTPPPHTSMAPQEWMALIVERQMRWMPGEARKLLALKYYRRGSQTWICRKLRIKPHQWGDKLYAARQNVLNLTRADLYPKIKGVLHNSRLPAFAEITA